MSRGRLEFWRYSKEPDPADETLMTGAEWESRMKLRATNSKEREKMRQEGGQYPAWLAEHLGLCPICQRPVYDDRLTCELHRDWPHMQEMEESEL